MREEPTAESLRPTTEQFETRAEESAEPKSRGFKHLLGGREEKSERSRMKKWAQRAVASTAMAGVLVTGASELTTGSPTKLPVAAIGYLTEQGPPQIEESKLDHVSEILHQPDDPQLAQILKDYGWDSSQYKKYPI